MARTRRQKAKEEGHEDQVPQDEVAQQQPEKGHHLTRTMSPRVRKQKSRENLKLKEPSTTAKQVEKLSPRSRKQKSREKLKGKLPSTMAKQVEKLSPRSRKRKSRENLKKQAANQPQEGNTFVEEVPVLEDILDGLRITEAIAGEQRRGLRVSIESPEGKHLFKHTLRTKLISSR